MHGKEQKLDKPFAVLHKVRLPPTTGASIDGVADDDAQSMDASSQPNDSALMSGSQSFLNGSMHNTRLDSTVAIEHKTKHNAEFHVKAIVTKRLVFKSRPKPIIANVAKQVWDYREILFKFNKYFAIVRFSIKRCYMIIWIILWFIFTGYISNLTIQ